MCITSDLKLVPAKCGCEGCAFEDADKCPGDDKPLLSACTDNEKGAMIFIKEDIDGTNL